jgi:hypothetical protein
MAAQPTHNCIVSSGLAQTPSAGNDERIYVCGRRLAQLAIGDEADAGLGGERSCAHADDLKFVEAFRVFAAAVRPASIRERLEGTNEIDCVYAFEPQNTDASNTRFHAAPIHR